MHVEHAPLGHHYLQQRHSFVNVLVLDVLCSANQHTGQQIWVLLQQLPSLLQALLTLYTEREKIPTETHHANQPKILFKKSLCTFSGKVKDHHGGSGYGT